jgi:hypothetical protein
MKKARELAEKEEVESEATVDESDQLSDSSKSETVPTVPNGV